MASDNRMLVMLRSELNLESRDDFLKVLRVLFHVLTQPCFIGIPSLTRVCFFLYMHLYMVAHPT